MHVHTVRTKYTFGDRVRYVSQMNGSGTGSILLIDFDEQGQVAYTIQVDGQPDLQGGILDDDITLLTDDPEVSVPVRV